MGLSPSWGGERTWWQSLSLHVSVSKPIVFNMIKALTKAISHDALCADVHSSQVQAFDVCTHTDSILLRNQRALMPGNIPITLKNDICINFKANTIASDKLLAYICILSFIHCILISLYSSVYIGWPDTRAKCCFAFVNFTDAVSIGLTFSRSNKPSPENCGICIYC